MEAAADRYMQLSRRRPLLGLPLAFAAKYTARQGILMASAVAFRLFLWLMPVALLTAGILAGVAGSSATAARSATNAAGVTGTASKEIVTALRDGHKAWWIAVIVGAFGVLWALLSLLRCLSLVSAHAWQVPSAKPRPRQLALTIVVFIGAWTALFVSGAVVPRLDRLPAGGLVLAIASQVVVATAAWFVVSLRLPDARTAWHDLLPGCVLFGVSISVLHALSRIYLPYRVEHSSELYGALGIAGVILAWLLIIGQVIVASAMANVVWTEYQHARVSP